MILWAHTTSQWHIRNNTQKYYCPQVQKLETYTQIYAKEKNEQPQTLTENHTWQPINQYHLAENVNHNPQIAFWDIRVGYCDGGIVQTVLPGGQ